MQTGQTLMDAHGRSEYPLQARCREFDSPRLHNEIKETQAFGPGFFRSTLRTQRFGHSGGLRDADIDARSSTDGT